MTPEAILAAFADVANELARFELQPCADIQCTAIEYQIRVKYIRLYERMTYLLRLTRGMHPNQVVIIGGK